MSTADKEAIKEAVIEAMRSELSVFYIDRETHYRQHQFLGEMIKYCEEGKRTVWKAIVTAFVGACLGLLCFGFMVRYKQQ